MEKKSKFKNWINGSFQFITLGMMAFCIFLLINQQREINNLKSAIRGVEYDCDLSDLEYKLDDLESKLDEVESNLSSEIDDVRRTVILWSD